MNTYELDDGDFVLSGNTTPNLLDKNDSLVQVYENLLSVWRGEWFADSDKGIHWVELLESKLYSIEDIRRAVTIELMRFETTESVLSVDIFVRDRTAYIGFGVKADGSIVNSEVAL